jgi:hypothetical protein
MKNPRGWLLIAGLITAVFATEVSAESASVTGPADSVMTPLEHRRGPEQTFLTFPEWFLVFSPAELAHYMQDHPPDAFPYFAHIKQFWCSYASVRQSLRDGHYPFNFGYHFMIVVIGTSTTVEYSMKSLYETLVGRLTALTLHGDTTAEDRYAAQVAQDYVDFIRVRPWYEYDFSGRLIRLWADTPPLGPHLLRKWERRYALTTEYAVKAVYGWFIKLGTHATYDTPLMVTAIVTDRLPAESPGNLLELRVLSTQADGLTLATVPRYDEFMRYAEALANQGADFREIAGNRGVILVSLLVPETWQPTSSDQHVLFTQPILTEPGRQRVVLTVPVPSLAGLLRAVQRPGLQLEHVFDY